MPVVQQLLPTNFQGAMDKMLVQPTPLSSDAVSARGKAISIFSQEGLKDVAGTMIAAARDRLVQIFADSPSGQAFQQSYVNQTVAAVQTSPTTWLIVGGVVLGLVYLAVRR